MARHYYDELVRDINKIFDDIRALPPEDVHVKKYSEVQRLDPDHAVMFHHFVVVCDKVLSDDERRWCKSAFSSIDYGLDVKIATRMYDTYNVMNASGLVCMQDFLIYSFEPSVILSIDHHVVLEAAIDVWEVA
ncbi:MAG: hypothetical protein ACTSRA_00160 [Promethearchaeota archaeon]|nr:MAG: hypothetical protein [Helarchaeota virus Nidhogg Meg22_1012]URC17369.1 MAG: hypothetical protein [Helarchaeota virus Nidhogg Meg22_1214]